MSGSWKYKDTPYAELITNWSKHKFGSQQCPHSSPGIPRCATLLSNRGELYRHIEREHKEDMKHTP